MSFLFTRSTRFSNIHGGTHMDEQIDKYELGSDVCAVRQKVDTLTTPAGIPAVH